MEHLSTIRLASNVEIAVRDARTGRLMDLIRTHNLVVDAGLQQLIDLSKGDTMQAVLYAAVGTSSLAVAANQTALDGEVFRNQLTTSQRTGKVWTLSYYLSSTQANGSTLKEYGEFTASSGGTMFARAIHDAINKTSSITVTYLHTVTFSAS